MNIFLDNIIFSLQRAGGISVVWQELLKRILKDSDFEVSLLDEPNQNLFRNQLDIPAELINHNFLSGFPIAVQRYINPKAKGGGIFHSSYYRTANNPGYINVTTVHDFTYEYYRNGLARFVHRTQKGNAIKKSKRIICVSQNTKDDLLKFYPETNPDQVTVIHNGVDSVYQPLADMSEFELKGFVDFSGGEYILFVGDRKSSYKNFRMAVEACSIANQPLVMVGNALLPEEESFLIEKLGKSRFKLLSGLSNDQLNLVYNHAFCLLYPSLYEGFGIPIIEAQRAGCPVITTNLSSIPEIAGSGAVLLADVSKFGIADTIKELKLNSSLIEGLKKSGFENSRRFSWDKCYRETKQVYQEVYKEYL